MIKAILLDADCKQEELSHEGQILVERLKDAAYDADDLLDEFVTVAEQLKRMPGGKLSKKVRRIFSNKNQLLFGYSKSHEIKKLREKLDEIADDCKKFGFITSGMFTTIKRPKEETMFYMMYWVCVSEEFGMKEILGKLLRKTGFDLEDLQTQVGGMIERKRYLLVLDDVWRENRVDVWREDREDSAKNILSF